MKDILEKEIKDILADLGIENPKVNFDIPTHMDMGDYSSNVAMAYAKQLAKKPLELAEEIKSKLKVEHVSKIDVAAPGFINFFFDKEYFGDVIKKIDSGYGKSE